MPDLYYNVGVRADGYYIEPPFNPRNIPVSDTQPISIPSSATLGDSVSIYTDGVNSNMGIYASNGAVVTAGEDLTINTHGSGENNFGVFAMNNAQITIKSAYIETEGKGSLGLMAWSQNNDGQGSKITVTEVLTSRPWGPMPTVWAPVMAARWS